MAYIQYIMMCIYNNICIYDSDICTLLLYIVYIIYNNITYNI